MHLFARSRNRGHDDGIVRIPPWPLRHPIVSSLIVVVALGAAVLLPWHPWSSTSACGPGLVPYGSPSVCVGLDQDSTSMKAADPLADLERRIAADDTKVTGAFATIVFLEDMTPDPQTDSVTLQVLRHGIEGAITAVDEANASTGTAGGALPKIKLLLANFGTLAAAGPQAEQAIENAPSGEHIVAVAGIGQSLDSTRAVIENLSAHGITTVGADVTADDLNITSSGQVIPDFFRVAPTNADQADAAAQYIRQHLAHQRILLVQDANTDDIYAQTLGTAFRAQFVPEYTETFQSPADSLTGVSRQDYMAQQFGGEHGDICADQPDLVFFAGRGVDLQAFMEALQHGGDCPIGPMTVLTGDDANDLVGVKLPSSPFDVDLLFTTLAASNEWPTPAPGAAASTQSEPPSSQQAAVSSAQLLAEEYSNYQGFATAFGAEGFAAADLDDGRGIMLHDAVIAAATAIRLDTYAVSNPSTLAATMLQLRCEKTVPGASGFIAFDDVTHNPVDKSMVVMRLDPSGTATPLALEWPEGSQVNYFRNTC